MVGGEQMTPDEAQLDRLLSLVAEHVDLDHCREVDERYRRALSWEETDWQPLVIQPPPFEGSFELPPPWDAFPRYPYSVAFDSPVAMMQNELLDRVIPGIVLRDDNPLGIRNNHGTIQIASLLGGAWDRHEDNYPWIEHFDSKDPLEAVASGTEIDLAGGILPRSFDTFAFYHDKLKAYPPCDEAIQVTLPDLQGPVDTAELLWGSDIYYAFVEAPDLLQRLMARIVDVMLVVAEEFRKRATVRLDPFACCQHGVMAPGRIVIRDDSAIMLSPDMYAEQVRPHDAAVLKGVGGGAIHFCGDGRHLIDKFLEIPDLRGLDLGQPEMMDVPAIYAKCRERRVSLIRLQPTRDDLLSGQAVADCPVGNVFLYKTKGLEDAREVLAGHRRNSEQ